MASPSLAGPRVIQERYRLLQRLGSGGVGTVYKAEDLEVGRTVAVKILHPQLAMDPLCGDVLRREVRLASTISHPNVVRVYDLGQIGGALMISMGLVEGEPLSAKLKREGALGQGLALDYFRQLLLGIGAAHEQGVVHRDLKPGNLLLDRNGRLVVSDFGMATLSKLDGEAQEDAGRAGGTLRYMSPEQHLGIAVDHRSDIYASGLVLLAMLIGGNPDLDCSNLNLRMPVDRETGVEVAAPKGTTPPVAAVLERCLRVNPADRFQSTAEVLEALDGKVRNAATPPGRKILPALQRKHVWAALALLLMVAFGAALIPLARARRHSAAREFQLGRDKLSASHDTASLRAAIQHFEAASGADDEHLAANLALASANIDLFRCTRAAGPLASAEGALTRALELSPGNPEAILMEAEVRVLQGRADEALRLIRPVLHADPANDKALRVLAAGQTSLGNSAAAIGAARKAVELGPSSWRNHAALSTALAAAKDYEPAMQALEQVLKLDSGNIPAINNLGIFNLQLGRYDAAIHYLEKAIQAEPTPAVLSNLGTAYSLTRRYRLAAMVFEKAVALEPASAQLHGNLAEAYLWNREKEKAFPELQRAIEIARTEKSDSPDNPELAARIAYYHALAGEYTDALRIVDRLPGVQSPRVRYRAAVIHQIAGRTTAGLRDLEAALGSGFPSALAFSDPHWDSIRSDPRFQALQRTHGREEPAVATRKSQRTE